MIVCLFDCLFNNNNNNINDRRHKIKNERDLDSIDDGEAFVWI